MKSLQLSPPLFLILLSLFTLIYPSISQDSISPTDHITGNQTLVSANNSFELGFFTPPDNSLNQYLGIWYKNIPVQTVVWVANRAKPIFNSTGVVKQTENGTLVVMDELTNLTVWSSVSDSIVLNPIAQLLDNGNFVVTNGSGYVWQSFDHPTDTLLSGMKLGVNLKTGLDRYINSWANLSDPAPGQYSFRLDLSGWPEFFLYRWSNPIYSSGPWDGVEFTGVPDLKSNEEFSFFYVSNEDEVYYAYEINNSSIISRFVMNSTGFLERYVWIEPSQTWSQFWFYPQDGCDDFSVCGPYGFCNTDTSPICNCLPGFEPKFPQQWNLRDGSGGCVRTVNLSCENDGFLVMSNLKLPESVNATVNESMSLDECRLSCLKDCSCRAYASANVSGGDRGCIIWNIDLVDMRKYDQETENLYIRLAASQLALLNKTLATSGNSDSKKPVIIITVTVSAGVLLLAIAGCWIFKKKKKKKKYGGKMTVLPSTDGNRNFPVRPNINEASLGPKSGLSSDGENTSGSNDLDLPSFDITEILTATGNFSADNKIGEGGFGPVYMGKLEDGQEIAVKRLSKSSTQGLEEFKTEVKLIAKLQHRNLVRLLGCCIDGEERILVYEYMHYRSLNTFIFDEGKRTLLSWQKRFTIILGIARGLLYLHQDSRFRIIHRDLKASNVLLDREMTPKISDFGVARIFGGDQTAAHTKKVVGTYGYMSPEYAMDGIFSMKSDVFSFGVIILEIVSGKRNRGFYESDLDLNLLKFAWRLWKEGKGLEFLDEAIGVHYNSSEVLRCIQVGLLCVQEQPRQRPAMSSVTMMLASENAAIPDPSEPGFSTGRNLFDSESSQTVAARDVTITMVEGR